MNFLNYSKTVDSQVDNITKETYTHLFEVSHATYGETVLKSSEMPNKY